MGWVKVKPLYLTLAVVAIALAASPTAASAQDDGVTYDPGSPAGKEYTIPLESARGTGSNRSPSRGDAPAGRESGADQNFGLFGDGVTRAPSVGRGSEADKRSGGRGRSAGHSGAQSNPASQGSTSRASRERRRFEQGVAASGGAGPLKVGGSVAGVSLLLALPLALFARSRRARGSAP